MIKVVAIVLKKSVIMLLSLVCFGFSFLCFLFGFAFFFHLGIYWLFSFQNGKKLYGCFQCANMYIFTVIRGVHFLFFTDSDDTLIRVVSADILCS